MRRKAKEPNARFNLDNLKGAIKAAEARRIAWRTHICVIKRRDMNGFDYYSLRTVTTAQGCEVVYHTNESLRGTDKLVDYPDRDVRGKTIDLILAGVLTPKQIAYETGVSLRYVYHLRNRIRGIK